MPYKPASDAERAPSLPSVSHIKNKMKRAEVLAKLRRAHFKTKLEKRKRDKSDRDELQKQGIEPERKVPRTIENTRVRDETTVARDDIETLQDEAVDELATYFAGKQPKILITTNTHPSKVRPLSWHERERELRAHCFVFSFSNGRHCRRRRRLCRV